MRIGCFGTATVRPPGGLRSAKPVLSLPEKGSHPDYVKTLEANY